MIQYSPMATVIQLLGGECTGTSALATDLAREVGAEVVPEELRAFVDRHGRAPVAHEQRAIMERQASALADILSHSAHESVIVCDPSPVMTAVYSVQYFKDHSLLQPAIQGMVDTDLFVWCQPDIPWTPDGLHRDGPRMRERTHEILETQVIPELADHSVVQARGNARERLDSVLGSLRR